MLGRSVLPRTTRRTLLAAASVAALLTSACGRAAPEPRPNVVLVSIDTLRADHLGCYGYERDTSPRLDRFAERSIRYANALAPAPWTLPSHASMLTGRDPFEIGVSDIRSTIPHDVATLAELLSQAGYQTAAFVDSTRRGFVGGERGFARGFEAFHHAPHVEDWTYRYDMAATVDAAQALLHERDAARPFFLFLHTKTVHSVSGLGTRGRQPPRKRDLDGDADAPYHTPAAYRQRFLDGGAVRFRWTDRKTGRGGVNYLLDLNERMREGSFDASSFPPEQLDELIGLYDGGIYYVDEQLGRLLDTLDETGLSEDTIVVVTADHGEEFLEHGQFFHEQLYGELLRVPLLLHDPRDPAETRGRTVESFVALADVTPTILERVGLPVPREMTGRPLPASESDGRAADTPLFSATVCERDDEQWKNSAVHSEGYKLVRQRLGVEPYSAELYDVAADPFDRRPLDGREELEARLQTLLDAWLADAVHAGDELELDEETLDGLRALGYGH